MKTEVTAKAIRAGFTPGRVVRVTNHYIDRVDHPCFGTRSRTILRNTSSHLHFDVGSPLPWPKAADLQMVGDTVQFYWWRQGERSLLLSVQFEEECNGPDDTHDPDGPWSGGFAENH